MTEWLAGLRREHTTGAFADEDAHPDPFEQFRTWLRTRTPPASCRPNAMTLSTVDADGRPTPDGAPQGIRRRGLVFYTHRTSRKGRQLAAHPEAALTFFWDVLERQVRVLGGVEWTTDAESDEYFHSRPRSSQLGAIVSNQSAVIPGRDSMEEALAELAARTADEPLERPATWGGYRVLPTEWEFWQGRPSRLHDRIRYRTDAHGNWTRERLAP